MPKVMTVSREEIIQHIKLACQVPILAREIASRKIILNAAKEAEMTVTLEELQIAADQLRLANQLLQSEDTWAWLRKHCLSLDEFEELAHCNIVSTKLAQKMFGDRVEAYFVEHQLDYTRVILHEVILKNSDLAMELFYAIQEGEVSFPEVAHRYIEDTELRRVSGYRLVTRADLKPEISAAVFAAKPPQLLKPIATSKGTHLIWVEEIIAPELDNTLFIKILTDLFNDWIDKQLNQIEIIVQLEEGDEINTRKNAEEILRR